MIGWEDVYKMVVAMAPLYFALILGYGSVRWWKLFTPEQGQAISTLVFYFTLPIYTFEFTSHVNPFKMNYRFVAADAVSKVVIVVVLAFWYKLSVKGSSTWFITSFSLSTLTSSLVIGAPLMNAIYGPMAVDLVVQSSVMQSIVWQTIVLFVMEFRRTRHISSSNTNSTDDIESNASVDSSSRPSLGALMKMVGMKLAKNPNSYACLFGLAWASISNRWHLELPSIIEGSILVMSKAGTGTSTFSMGIFTALQQKLIAFGVGLTMIGMILRFIAGPAAMTVGSIAVGLRGDVLHVAIIQAALPQSIASFILAKEYGLHAEVLSTAVILGMIVSLPVSIAYYAILEFAH